MTTNGCGSGYVLSPIVTCLSCIASRSALCTFAGARLISSARTRFAKTGPRWGLNSPVFGWKTMVPTTSLGRRSGVNWMRSNWTPRALPKDFTSNVLASPGMPSRRTWPPARSATRSRSTAASWPMTALPISSRSFLDQAGPEDMLKRRVLREDGCWESGLDWRDGTRSARKVFRLSEPPGRRSGGMPPCRFLPWGCAVVEAVEIRAPNKEGDSGAENRGVVAVESREDGTVEVENPHQGARAHDRHHDLRPRPGVAGDVAGEFIDVGHGDHRAGLGSG